MGNEIVKRTRAERRAAGEGVYRIVSWWNSSYIGIIDYPPQGTRRTGKVKMSKKERRKRKE